MPITEQQAVEWAGSVTADELTALPTSSNGRLTLQRCHQMISVSTAVVHCLIPGGAQPPVLPLPEGRREPASTWCAHLLTRDDRKRQTLSGARLIRTGLANTNGADDDRFLRTFGHKQEIADRGPGSPFLKIMYDPMVSAMMHNYVQEAVQWMLKGGTSRNSFLPLLWAGFRDWATSSAWTRGVVFLYAKEYKQRVQAALHHHQQSLSCLTLDSMPITEHEATAWAGPQSADDLIPIPERLTWIALRLILDFRTAVIHCLVPGGLTPPLSFRRMSASLQLQELCRKVLERDATRRQSCDEALYQDNIAIPSQLHKAAFLRTLGHVSILEDHLARHNYPFVQLMFDPALDAEIHAYIAEAVRIMMRYGTSQRSFIPLLWAGLRDWETCSAWTRGKILLAARNYREAVERGKAQHVKFKTNELLVSMGLEPNHSLAHLPSLTARQTRRNGISECELRARWG
ncbi:hypothetical protein BCR35DRAFT_335118 [Leucosporidium creatinivorum]|uniref:Uncharacterized protein n=1 Tax=Leucosporidium creatinivorum TaxID=106004 RepID=A0A1Y2DIE9_9BASI|nr:hypothetical protein BCR35DRAFT_335118 [Leucosporidium creatinivorum]